MRHQPGAGIVRTLQEDLDRSPNPWSLRVSEVVEQGRERRWRAPVVQCEQPYRGHLQSVRERDCPGPAGAVGRPPLRPHVALPSHAHIEWRRARRSGDDIGAARSTVIDNNTYKCPRVCPVGKEVEPEVIGKVGLHQDPRALRRRHRRIDLDFNFEVGVVGGLNHPRRGVPPRICIVDYPGRDPDRNLSPRRRDGAVTHRVNIRPEAVFRVELLKSSDEIEEEPFVTKNRSVVEVAFPEGSVAVMR